MTTTPAPVPAVRPPAWTSVPRYGAAFVTPYRSRLGAYVVTLTPEQVQYAMLALQFTRSPNEVSVPATFCPVSDCAQLRDYIDIARPSYTADTISWMYTPVSRWGPRLGRVLRPLDDLSLKSRPVTLLVRAVCDEGYGGLRSRAPTRVLAAALLPRHIRVEAATHVTQILYGPPRLRLFYPVSSAFGFCWTDAAPDFTPTVMPL